ncbi:MAG TPA: tetratricopeptide repeat protein [Xanthobacteraceae bacterium]|nr:tetratricopeptide repeat protein [Xanthobacteraceae bacterium]
MAIGPASPGAAQDSASGNDALDRATFALNNQRPQDAAHIAGEVLKADPRQTRALYILGYALLAQGRAEDAIAPLESAGRAKQDPDIDTALAIALRQAGRLDDALSRLKRTAKRHPRFAPAFRELGSLLFATGRYDEAIAALRRGLDVAPMTPELSIELGYVFLHRRDSANAKTAFARALSIVPNAPEALFGMAKAHQEIGENEAAAGYFRRYLMGRPGDAGAWLTLGHCLLELGQRDAGYDCFRAVARNNHERYAEALHALVASGRGRFWLRPTAAARFMRGKRS